MSPLRLTLDMTALRDRVDDKRERHGDAVRLFAAAASGRVELAVAPQGHRFDAEGQLSEHIAVLIGAGVTELPQLARISDVTVPSPTLLPGNYVRGFNEAWAAVVEDWKTHEGRAPGSNDRWHVETHIRCERDVFITDDRALRAMCRRLTDEHGFQVAAEGLSEFVGRVLSAGP